MTRIKKIAYSAYSAIKRFPPAATAAAAIYLKKHKVCSTKKRVPIRRDRLLPEDLSQLKVALICDDMTYQNFQGVCITKPISTGRWYEELVEFDPDILFCESAWSGCAENNDCWRIRVYRNHNVWFEHRKPLLELVSFCRESNIPTVFWNKEDPYFFGSRQYDFASTALKFDYIFTTASECVQRYIELGAKKVDVLPFGYSPGLFNAEGQTRSENTAVFAGSWYADNPQRCIDMEKLFDLVISRGIELKIYDRHYGSENKNFEYPQKYSKYVHPAVKYEELQAVMKNAKYIINVNSVTDSETMFARRVFEVLACEKCLISNYSLGMEKLFGEKIWMLDREFDSDRIDEYCLQNRQLVEVGHTWKCRIERMIEIIRSE